MTNILGKDNAFWKNQFNRIAWIAPFFCRCFIGSFRCIPSLAAFVWLVSSVSFDQRFAVAQNATPDIDVQFAADQTANFQRTEIQVLDPDGNIAKNAKYVCGDSIVVELNGSFEIIGPAHRGRVIISAKQLNDDGMLPMRHEPNSTFVAVWNEKGFYQASIARLPATKSIQLKKWASLEITAMADGKPDDGVNLVITSHLTSDGLFQGLEFKIRDLADRNGKAKFPMIAPGEINIQSDVKQETVGFVTKLSYGRSKTVFIEAGSKVRVQVGGTGRKVSGNLSFIESNPLLHFGLLQGEIRCREAGESIPIRILDDGTFDCDDVPFGECTVHIRNSGSQSPNKGVAVKIFTGIKIFACSDDKSGELAIGTIPVEERVLVNPTLAEPSKVIVMEDEFRSNHRVALVATKKNGDSNTYVLLDERGKLVRELEDTKSPRVWGSDSQFVDFDFERNRIYLLSDYYAKSGVQSLHSLDISGRRLRSLALPSGSCRISVDTVIGNVWVLSVQQVGKSTIHVYDPDLNVVASYPLNAFTMCYSKIDKAFWLVGSTDIKRVDPATGETLHTHKLPAGIWTIANVIPDPLGGVVALEMLQGNRSASANRLLRIDSEATQIANADLDAMHVTSIAFIGDEFWACGFIRRRMWAFYPATTKIALSFDRTLVRQTERKIDFSALGGAADGKTLWAVNNNELQRFSVDSENHIQLSSSVPFPYNEPLTFIGP